MKKDELIRYRAGLAALLVSGSMFLSGCAKGFELTVDEERNIVAEEDSYINNDFIEKCYVVEAKSNITGDSNIYLAKRRTSGNYPKLTKEYVDVFTNMVLFAQENDFNTSFEYIKETPLFDYLVSLNLVKGSYSYDDMKNIYEEIKSIYEFENDKELVK